MDTTSVAYVLCRIEDDSSLTPVSRHRDFLTGIAAAGPAVEGEDFDFAYALYAGDPILHEPVTLALRTGLAVLACGDGVRPARAPARAGSRR